MVTEILHGYYVEVGQHSQNISSSPVVPNDIPYNTDIEGSRLPIIRTALVDQIVKNKISCEKSEEWLPCLAYRPKHSNS